jgi:hypothetical protein
VDPGQTIVCPHFLTRGRASITLVRQSVKLPVRFRRGSGLSIFGFLSLRIPFLSAEALRVHTGKEELIAAPPRSQDANTTDIRLRRTR